ncbi:MAG: hypothetical protein J5J06_12065 [Phycisphaerae bacterium]|nr:hypothetical protein [Phycisphaerae bacterium]
MPIPRRRFLAFALLLIALISAIVASKLAWVSWEFHPAQGRWVQVVVRDARVRLLTVSVPVAENTNWKESLDYHILGYQRGPVAGRWRLESRTFSSPGLLPAHVLLFDFTLYVAIAALFLLGPGVWIVWRNRRHFIPLARETIRPSDKARYRRSFRRFALRVVVILVATIVLAIGWCYAVPCKESRLVPWTATGAEVSGLAGANEKNFDCVWVGNRYLNCIVSVTPGLQLSFESRATSLGGVWGVEKKRGLAIALGYQQIVTPATVPAGGLPAPARQQVNLAGIRLLEMTHDPMSGDPLAYSMDPYWAPREVLWRQRFSPAAIVRYRQVSIPGSYIATLLIIILLIIFMRGPLRRYRCIIGNCCLYCGYSLTGLIEPRCPECGERFPGTVSSQGAVSPVAIE